jgi:hypothetical protein
MFMSYSSAMPHAKDNLDILHNYLGLHKIRIRSRLSSPTPAVTVSTVYAIVVLAPYDFQVHHSLRVIYPVY